MFKLFKLLAFIGLCSFSLVSFAHDGATGIVKERMDRFSKNQENLKQIKYLLRNGDLNSIAPLALEIRDWAIEMHEYFPKGTDGKPSEASPKIWEDFEGFKLAAKANAEAADILYNAALSANKGNVLEALKQTASTCSGCHKVYRLN